MDNEKRKQKKAVILDFSPVLIRRILSLPPEAEIVDVRMNFDHRGVVEILVHGCGFHVNEGELIQHSTGVVITGYPEMHWDFLK